MTTRLDLRFALRRKLEDTGINPLWDDALLNDTLWNSLVRLGARIPLEASVSVPIPPNTTSIVVSPTIPNERLLRVIEPAASACRLLSNSGRAAWARRGHGAGSTAHCC